MLVIKWLRNQLYLLTVYVQKRMIFIFDYKSFFTKNWRCDRKVNLAEFSRPLSEVIRKRRKNARWIRSYVMRCFMNFNLLVSLITKDKQKCICGFGKFFSHFKFSCNLMIMRIHSPNCTFNSLSIIVAKRKLKTWVLFYFSNPRFYQKY